MAWGMASVLMAAPYVYSGVSGYISGNAQADNENAYSVFNAQAIGEAGDATADSLLATGELKGAITKGATKATIARRTALTEYNAKYAYTIGDYNAQLLEREAMLVWEAMGLDLRQMKAEHDTNIGRLRVSHGASGAIMDQDSAQTAVDTMRDRQDLESFIVRRGADIKARKLLDQAATSRWKGAVEANTIVFEGQLLNQSDTINANLSAYGDSVQAGIDAKMVTYNSNVATYQSLVSGDQKSSASRSQANSSLVSGLFGAGTAAGASYLMNKVPASTFKTGYTNTSMPTGFGSRVSVAGGSGGV